MTALTWVNDDGTTIDTVPLKEAHRRLARYFTPEGSGSYGYAEQQASDVLAVIFSDREKETRESLEQEE